MWGATAAMGAGGEAAGLVIVGALSSVVLPASLERAPHSVRGKWGGLGKWQSLVPSHAFCLPGRPHGPTPTPTKHRDFLPPNPLVRNPTSTPTNTNMPGTAPPDCQRKVNSTANNKLQKVWAGSSALQRVLIYARCVLPRLAVSKF